MALRHEVRGVGDRSKFFFAGRPATLLAFDDAIVLLPSSVAGGIAYSFGAVGALAREVQLRKQSKDRESASGELAARDFSDHKRARVIPYSEISDARLEAGRIQRKLLLGTSTGTTKLKYPPKAWPDEEATAFLREKLGDRFAAPSS